MRMGKQVNSLRKDRSRTVAVPIVIDPHEQQEPHR